MSIIRDNGNFEAIVFDLGGVILNLDYLRTVEKLRELLIDFDPVNFYGKEAQLDFFSQYEIGSISTVELLHKFNSHYHSNLSLELFKAAWNAMILDFPKGRIDLIKKLSKMKRIFLLSNINALHEEAVVNAFAKLSSDSFNCLFEKVYYSHRTGMRKPDGTTFRHILSENKITPAKTLFIDDSMHHVLGALQEGIHAVHLFFPKTIETLFAEIEL